VKHTLALILIISSLLGSLACRSSSQPAATDREKPLRVVLGSVAENLRRDEWQMTHRDVPFPVSTPWTVRKYTLHGGRQEGVEVISIEHEGLRMQVSPTRGMSILRVDRGEIRLGWDSPVKEIVHPRTIDLPSRGGLGWLEGFNEWMVRCGLEWAGHPGRDRFIDNTGAVAEMDLTLHGRIGNLPASEVELLVDPQPPHRLRLRGRVDERSFHGPKLELWTEVSTEPGSPILRIADQIHNRGASPQEFELIYHANFGPPLLEEGARFVGAIGEVTPFNVHAAQFKAKFAEYEGPRRGFVEEVFLLSPLADARKQATAMLRNRTGDKAVSLTYSPDELPWLTLWKNTAALEDGYVTGIEPGTSSPANRRLERAAGRLPVLGPGESRRFHLEVRILSESTEVQAVEEAIRTLQLRQPTVFSPRTVR
jgi:hypothetical protein